MEEKVKAKRREMAEELARARKEAGMTQFELADLAGVGRSSVAVWEAGYNFPRLDSLLRVADALDKDLEIRLVDKGNQMTQMKE